jgi:hypothetical protein
MPGLIRQSFHIRVLAGALLGALISANVVSCGQGGGSPNEATMASTNTSASSAVTSASSATGTATQVLLQGIVTYDSVKPAVNSTNGSVFLDYNAVAVKPIRGATIELLDSLNRVVLSTVSDSTGAYAFEVAANLAVKVRVKAQLSASNYSISIRDNTQGNAQYVLDGRLEGSGSSEIQTRDLHANLGWNNSNAYTSERQSAPFAILDALYDSLLTVLQVDSSVALPPLDVYWSPNNIANNGDLNLGNIGSSFYSPGATAIYVLGSANNDTDEFDNTVIQHEFGHFIEDSLSRSESIGGVHFLGAPLDMRLAFGEGFGNAFAGISSGQPFYLDSNGASQQNGFGFDLENNRYGGGYYNEGAIQAVLYDLFDQTNEPDDSLSLGFGPILAALSHSDYLAFDGFSSIFPFIDVLKRIVPEQELAINRLLLSQNINGIGPYGLGETATGSVSFSLPIYQRLSPGNSVEACSNNNIQEYNGLEVRRFILLEVPTQGIYTIMAERSSGIQPSDPDFHMFRQGVWAGLSDSSINGREVWTRQLEQGTYALSVYEALNTDEIDATGGLVCFNVTLN